MLSRGNKIIVNHLGAPIVLNKIPEIEFEIRSAQFPAWVNNSPNVGYRLGFNSSSENIIFIDFGDGSPIYSEAFTSQWLISSVTHLTGIHQYANSNSKTVKIWFEKPNAITTLISNYVQFFGDFPKQLGFYRLDNLTITYSRFGSFPIDFKGGFFNLINLIAITTMSLYSLPDWILNSRIVTLRLFTDFQLNNVNNRMSELVKIKDLTNLIWNNNALTDEYLPSNLKDISSLRIINFGSNPIGSITQKINDMKQIDSLRFGYDVTHSTLGISAQTITSWGVGVGGMNITSFYLQAAPAVNTIPVTALTGFENCLTLKTIFFRSIYFTQAKINDVIANYYNLVVANAVISSSSSVTGKLRLITIYLGGINASTGYNTRPSGTYQAPSGFVLGSHNGSPASPMEIIYVLNKNYRWTIEITNTSGNGNQSLTP